MGRGALWRDNQQSTFAHIHTSSSHSTTSPWSPIPYPHCVSTPGWRHPSLSWWEAPWPRLLCPSRTTGPRRSGPSGSRCWPRRGRPLSTGPRATSRYYRWTVCRTRRAGNSSPRGAGARIRTPLTRGRGAGAAPWRRAPRCRHGREPSSRTRIAPRGFLEAGRLHRVAADGVGHPRRGPRHVGGGPARSVAPGALGVGVPRPVP